MRRPSLVLAAGLLAALLLTGCAADATPRLTVLPAPLGSEMPPTSPSADPTPSLPFPAVTGPAPSSPEATVACVNGAAAVDAGSGAYVLGAGCQKVTVSGTGIRLRTDDVAIGTLAVQGDRNVVLASGTIGAVTIEGQDNEVAAHAVDTLTLRGQRNRVTSSATVADMQIAGNGNTVLAPRVETVQVSGDGNSYPGS